MSDRTQAITKQVDAFSAALEQGERLAAKSASKARELYAAGDTLHAELETLNYAITRCGLALMKEAISVHDELDLDSEANIELLDALVSLVTEEIQGFAKIAATASMAATLGELTGATGLDSALDFMSQMQGE